MSFHYLITGRPIKYQLNQTKEKRECVAGWLAGWGVGKQQQLCMIDSQKL